MPSLVQIIKSDSQLTSLLSSNKNVVIDFHAVWCGPCKATAPVFEKLAESLTNPGTMIFVKCDVDECVEVARKYNVTAMPTFVVFKDAVEIKRVQGANIPALSAVVKELIEEAKGTGSGVFGAGGSSSASGESKGWLGASLPKGYWDVSEEIELSGMDILNANTEAGVARALFKDTEPNKDKADTKDYVESDTDEQLMIFIPFRSTVKLHTIHITSFPSQNDDDDEEVGRPTKLKLYVNRANIVGFDEANDLPATQEIELSKDSWDAKTGTAVISTRFVKFQSVSSLTIFVEEGEEGCDKTRIDRIRLVGEAGEKRDMGKLEKVKDGHE